MTTDCGNQTMPNRYATRWLRLRCYLRPSASPGYRDMIAIGMIGEGLIRAINGLIFPTPVMDYLPTRLWGLLELLMGIALLATRRCERRSGLIGRIVASLGCGFLVAMAASLWQASAPSAFIHAGASFILALEAQVNDECQ